MNKERFRNYGLWVSLASLILLVLQTSGVGVDVGKYNQIVNQILGIFVALGVLSNPKEGKWFTDQTSETKDDR